MLNLIKNEIEKQNNCSVTENGAIGYKSTGSALVDMNYKVSSFRNSNENEIITCFDKAFDENKEYALRWLFFARDVRGGLGERRLFRVCYRRLVELDSTLFLANLDIIPEYGRWDDLISLLGISKITDEHIIKIIQNQLNEDLNQHNKSISLLAKWLPSENASSLETKALAKQIRKHLGLSSKHYRLILSGLRKKLDVVEVKMCSNEWESIDYEYVPSLANLRYRNAFMKHDHIRRLEYLDSLKKGESRMNMSVSTPVDVVSKYGNYFRGVGDYDETLELAWKNLKDVMIGDTLVVADGSGSMLSHVSGKITALSVANALAIYTSEHNKGVYENIYITFSNTPQFVDLSNADSLHEKLNICRKHHEIANTNIEAVFDLILKVAVDHEIPENQMINNILIISDMEFDQAQRSWLGQNVQPLTAPLFEEIRDRYNEKGYNLPRLIFWNVNSRTKTIPLTENELGVTLVSGFSQNVLKMVMSNKYDPYEVLVEAICNERYDKVKV